MLNKNDDAIDKSLLAIEKQFGKGSIIKLGDANIETLPFVSTGILPLDIALGIGGIPLGRIIEIYGPESSGKTTLTLNILAQVQKLGGVVAFIDAEHALDPGYAAKIGVNVNELLVSQPNSGEQALEITEHLASNGGIDVIVVDSVAALTPQAEIDAEMKDMQVGLQARLMSKAMRKLTSVTHKTKTTIIFINQIRMKIGVMFGSPETTTGGNALKFYSSIRMDIRKVETIKKDDEAIANMVKVKVVKNKVAPPFKECHFQINFDGSASNTMALVEEGSKLGLISKAGTWYSYGEEKLAQGKENSAALLSNRPDVLDHLYNSIRKHYLHHNAVLAYPDDTGKIVLYNSKLDPVQVETDLENDKTTEDVKKQKK